MTWVYVIGLGLALLYVPYRLCGIRDWARDEQQRLDYEDHKAAEAFANRKASDD